MSKKLDLEREKDAVDLVTNSMFTLDLLEQLTLAIRDPEAGKVPVRDFYLQWLAARKLTEHKPPFNLGAITGYIYCGLLLTKENWADLLPNETLDTLDADWGISRLKVAALLNSNPDLVYTIRRIRNSLGHANFFFTVPDNFTPENVHETVTITFRDTNQRNPADTFEVELKMLQIEKLIKKFQSVVHTTMKSKTS